MKQYLTTKKLLLAGALLAYVVCPALILGMRGAGFATETNTQAPETLVKSTADAATHTAVVFLKRYTNIEQE